MSENISKWVNDRFPLKETWDRHLAKYLAPKNLNFWYFFGAFSILVLVNQVVTGIWLSMYYDPTAADAFNSIEHIMRDVHFGWLLRYMHSTGSSAFFIVIYLHMYRGIMYGSFKKPRELIWLIGMLLYIFLVIESVTGYVLPWGQMSYWAGKIFTQAVTVVPFVGKTLSTWLMGDYVLSGVTLHRFFAFHVIAIPLILLLLTFLHMVALHHVGSNNPDGIDVTPSQKIPFFPYYVLKDLVGVVVFLMVFFAIVFYAPTMHGYFLEYPNFEPANMTVTPLHIAPPWYLAAFYSGLRAVPSKFGGVFLVAVGIAFLFVLPWLDRSKVRSIRYRGVWSKVGLTLLVISFVGLGVLGTMPLTDLNLYLARFFGFIYLSVFIAMPFYTKYEKTKSLPGKLT